MKLGIFDSGLGGLLITKAIRRAMPDIDLLYFGDTLHLPYGNRSDGAIFEYTRRAMEHMFAQGCTLIVLACNTASAAALRKLQQEWLPAAHPGKNIIGVVVPTLETAIGRGYRRFGLIATNYVIGSNVFQEELQKINPDIVMFQKATPLLVPLIENGGMKWVPDVLRNYLDPMLKENIECLILGCTHYPFLKNEIKNITGDKVVLISQDDIIPEKLAGYLRRHPEYRIGRGGTSVFQVSDLTDNYRASARAIYGEEIAIEKVAA